MKYVWTFCYGLFCKRRGLYLIVGLSHFGMNNIEDPALERQLLHMQVVLSASGSGCKVVLVCRNVPEALPLVRLH